MEKINMNLEGKSVQQLDQLLRAELQKETPDEKTVLKILDDLKNLETGDTEQVSAKAQAAWRTYQNNIAKYSKTRLSRYRVWLIRCAAIIAVVCMLVVALPQAVAADSILGKMVRWAERVFETFIPSSTHAEYVFYTDHPGLQELYNKVTEAGVTQSVVPMWMPEDLEAGEIIISNSPAKVRVHVRLVGGENWVSCTIDKYEAEKESNYAKDSVQFQEIEVAGITHYMLSNDDSCSVVWIVDNVECTIASNFNEDVLYQILYSVYQMEVKE